MDEENVETVETCGGMQMGQMAILIFLLLSIIMGMITCVVSQYIYHKCCRPKHDDCGFHNSRYRDMRIVEPEEQAILEAQRAREQSTSQQSAPPPTAPDFSEISSDQSSSTPSCSYNSMTETVRLPPSYNEVVGGR